MLRRKRKGPKPPASPAPGASRARRRARAPVPPELILPPEKAHAVVAKPPAKEAPRKEPGRKPKGTILVTGFEPFGGEATNPSWRICERLPAEVAGLRVETLRVPCEFRNAIEVVAEAIERLQPAIVLSLGQAGGRSRLSVERVAINLDDARAPDNAGQQPVDEPIAASGPPAYFATLPVKAMVVAIRDAGVPAEVSNSAGTYVCNHLMYGVLHFLAASGRPARAGFMHVPYAEDQVLDKAGLASMSVDAMARGVEAALAAAVAHKRDLHVPEGTLD